MFNILENSSFVEFYIKEGRIPFIVRGNLDCYQAVDFAPIFDIKIYPPTFELSVVKKNDESNQPIFIKELHEEAVFSGHVELHESSLKGVSVALWVLERWADFLCFSLGNPSLQVEVQLPFQAMITISGRKLDQNVVDRWAELVIYHHQLDDDTRQIIANALWWYRKGCNTARYSTFDSYTAYWNALEILCEVSGSKINKGKEVDMSIQDYLQSKKEIKAGHILECYNRFVNYSISQQMKDTLQPMFGSQADRVVYHCFEISPENNRLYQIRNDINHGNIRENSPNDRLRVHLRGMLLRDIVMRFISAKLGRKISPPMDIDGSWEKISSILEENDN